MLPASTDRAVPGYSIAAMRLLWDARLHAPVADGPPRPCPARQRRSRRPCTAPPSGRDARPRPRPPPGAARGALLRPPERRPCSPARASSLARPFALPPRASTVAARAPTRGGRLRGAASLRDPAAALPTGGGERGRAGGRWPGAGRGDGGRHGSAAGRSAKNVFCAAVGEGPAGPRRREAPPPTHAASRRAARARPEAARRGAAAAHPRLPPRGAAAARKRPPGAASADVRATRPAEPLSSPLSYLTLAAVVSDGLSKERHGYPGRDGAGPSGGGREEGVTGLQRAALCLGTARAVGGQRLGPARGYGLLCSHVEFFVTVVVSALGTVNVAQMQLEGTRGVRCVLGTGCQCPAILLGSGAIDDALLVPGQPEVLTLRGWALRGTWHEGAAFSAQGREAFKALVSSGLHRPASLIARGCQTCGLTSLVLASLVWKYPHVEGRAAGALSQAYQTHRVQHTEVPSLFKVTSPDDPYVFINIYIY